MNPTKTFETGSRQMEISVFTSAEHISILYYKRFHSRIVPNDPLEEL